MSVNLLGDVSDAADALRAGFAAAAGFGSAHVEWQQIPALYHLYAHHDRRACRACFMSDNLRLSNVPQISRQCGRLAAF